MSLENKQGLKLIQLALRNVQIKISKFQNIYCILKVFLRDPMLPNGAPSLTQCITAMYIQELFIINNILKRKKGIRKAHLLSMPESGFSLADACSLYVCGVPDVKAILRGTLLKILKENNKILYFRWQKFVLGKKLCDQSDVNLVWNRVHSDIILALEAMQGLRVENSGLHLDSDLCIFVMSNICRRPLIVLRLVEEGSSSIYLPLLLTPEDCIRNPIYLAVHKGHFYPILFETAGAEDHTQCLIPLTDGENKLFEVPFLLEHESAAVVVREYLQSTTIYETNACSVSEKLAAKLIGSSLAKSLYDSAIDPMEVLQEIYKCFEETQNAEYCLNLWNKISNPSIDQQGLQTSELSLEHGSIQVQEEGIDEQEQMDTVSYLEYETDSFTTAASHQIYSHDSDMVSSLHSLKDPGKVRPMPGLGHRHSIGSEVSSKQSEESGYASESVATSSTSTRSKMTKVDDFLRTLPENDQKRNLNPSRPASTEQAMKKVHTVHCDRSFGGAMDSYTTFTKQVPDTDLENLASQHEPDGSGSSYSCRLWSKSPKTIDDDGTRNLPDQSPSAESASRSQFNSTAENNTPDVASSYQRFIPETWEQRPQEAHELLENANLFTYTVKGSDQIDIRNPQSIRSQQRFQCRGEHTGQVNCLLTKLDELSEHWSDNGTPTLIVDPTPGVQIVHKLLPGFDGLKLQLKEYGQRSAVLTVQHGYSVRVKENGPNRDFTHAMRDPEDNIDSDQVTLYSHPLKCGVAGCLNMGSTQRLGFCPPCYDTLQEHLETSWPSSSAWPNSDNGCKTSTCGNRASEACRGFCFECYHRSGS